MNSRFLAFAALAATSMLAAPSSANDSSAAIGLGGLELTQNDAVSMDSEDLFISKSLVTVKYRYTNTSTTDARLIVSFPLPPIPSGLGGYYGDQSYPDWKELGFKTLVDGKEVTLDYREVVSIAGDASSKDISARLRALGWPVRFWDDYKFTESLQELPAESKAAYVKEGLLYKEAEADYWIPNWQLATHVTRTQLFPAGKTVTVEHSYIPVAGGSVGGNLDRQYREGKEGSKPHYVRTYCTDQAFWAGFDKRNAEQSRLWIKKTGQPSMNYTETWLSYVLKSGANWKGPIKDFRLVVEKEKPGNLLSMCMTGVKKISPTRFEVRKSNFEPTDNLNILIVEYIDPDSY
jgi:hypothetical protein